MKHFDTTQSPTNEKGAAFFAPLDAFDHDADPPRRLGPVGLRTPAGWNTACRNTKIAKRSPVDRRERLAIEALHGTW